MGTGAITAHVWFTRPCRVMQIFKRFIAVRCANSGSVIPWGFETVSIYSQTLDFRVECARRQT
jgi:hypothetical protein